MIFKSSYNVVIIFTIFSCLLELHISKCGLTDYKRIDIKKILELQEHDENDAYFDEEKYREDNVANDHIQDILNKLSNNVNDNDDFNAHKQSRSLRQNVKSSSDSDFSEERIQVNSKNRDDLKHIVNKVLRSHKRFNVTGGGENNEKGELGHSHSGKDKGFGTKEKLKDHTNVFNYNITLRSSCNKGAAKACKKACKGVLKSVCHEFKCSHGMKSRFKLECKKNCREKFDA